MSCKFVIELPKSVQLKEGEDLKLTCQVEGDIEPRIEWYKNDEPLTDDHRVDIYSNKNHHYLEVQDCKLEYRGVYKAVAINYPDSPSNSSTIEIAENPAKSIDKKRFYYYSKRHETYYPPEFIIKPTNQTEFTYSTID